MGNSSREEEEGKMDGQKERGYNEQPLWLPTAS